LCDKAFSVSGNLKKTTRESTREKNDTTVLCVRKVSHEQTIWIITLVLYTAVEDCELKFHIDIDTRTNL